jgi:phosphoserine phosphatase
MNDTSERIRGIVAFDLDGTILRGDTVCEMLAKPIGRLEEMQRFEAFTDETDIIGARERMAEWYGGYSLHDLEEFLNDPRKVPPTELRIRD